MTWQFAKILISACTIGFASWLAGRQPKIAGFLMALPLASMLALAFFQIEYRDPAKASLFAKSILSGVPLSLLFFIPFVFAQKFSLGFWSAYFLGTVLLALGFWIQRVLF